MSLLKYAIAAAIGYYAGQPGGRRQIQQLGQKATELVRSPKAAELKDRSRELVGERASAAVDKVRRKTTDDSTSSGATTTTTGTATAGSASVTTPAHHPRHRRRRRRQPWRGRHPGGPDGNPAARPRVARLGRGVTGGSAPV